MIPESAVEAAMRHFPPLYRSVVVAALEAAAPHMLAEAWDDGMEAMHATTGGEWPAIPDTNPHRPTP